MNPDLEKRVPREILAELIEEGTEAFRGILEKLFNVAMQLERSEFLGAEAYERTASRRGYRNGFKGKRIQTRVGELHLEIPQVRGLRFYPKSLERGCRSEKALKLAIAEMYVMGVSTRKVTEITEQLCGLEISATGLHLAFPTTMPSPRCSRLAARVIQPTFPKNCASAKSPRGEKQSARSFAKVRLRFDPCLLRLAMN